MHGRWQLVLRQSACLAALGLLGCGGGSDASDAGDSSTGTTSSGGNTSGGATSSASSVTSGGGSSNTGSSGGSGGNSTTGNTSTSGTATDGSGGDPPEFAELGVCGLRSQGIVTQDSYEAYEEFYLLADEGDGEDICVVRFDLTRVGAGPSNCDQFAGQQEECLWSHLVQYQNPTVLVDENGVCADSELAMDMEAIEALDGSEVAYGYVFEYQGHNSVLLTHDAEQNVWNPVVNAGWSEESGDFLFDRRDGFCGY